MLGDRNATAAHNLSSVLRLYTQLRDNWVIPLPYASKNVCLFQFGLKSIT